jgi:hypothetical protein
VIGSFLRGLSTRDVEAVLEDTFEEPIGSRSTVSRILEDTRERYRRWCERRLSEHDVIYCFLDAIYLKLHPDDEPAEGVLVCWGVTLEGRKRVTCLARIRLSDPSVEASRTRGRSSSTVPDVVSGAARARARQPRELMNAPRRRSRTAAATSRARCEQALEDEVTEFLGRARSRRGSRR